MGALDESPEWEKIPRAERDELSAVLGKEWRQIKLRRWLDGGYSGSPVALIRDTMSGRPSREMILKFCSRGFPEVHGLEYAYELAPDEFSAQHLVAVKRTFPLREWWGVLTEIAGGDLSLPSLAIYLTDDQLPKICGILIKSILADWNSGNRELGEEINTGKFLRRVVGPHKIEDGGSLSGFASRAGLSWHDPWIRRQGWDEPLRNPLAMLSEDFGGEMFAVVGIGHGDLSVFNVLIRGMPVMEPLGYWLIDYGASNDKHPLTRDPMYLLLSLATQWLQGITITHRTSQSLIRLLANSEDRVKSSQLLFYEKVRDEIYNTGYEWANDKSYGHYWKPQSQLSMIGCALAFIGRKIGDIEVTATDDWLFDLAAVAATEYCRVNKPEPAPMPSTLPLRESPPPGPLPPGPLATSPPSLTVVEPPAVSGQAAELIGALEGATFGREHWTQLELGTRDLRARLGQGFEAGTESSVLIAGRYCGTAAGSRWRDKLACFA